MKETTASRLTLRRSEDRGHVNHGWLEARHSFSFGSYHDPAHMGFRSLRVINQDRIAGGGGFPPHPHRDMEIFSYVLEGGLRHEDSMGNQGVIRPGQIQVMSAGRGVYHSEANASASEDCRLLQIWLLPERGGLDPSYAEWTPSPERRDNSKVLLISPDGRDDSATIHQDALVYRLKLKAGEEIPHSVGEGRAFWLQVIAGDISVDNETLHPGDAASSEEAGDYHFTAQNEVEALLFDLA
ncbi:MAG: pirin family protein [Verrucomicrobiales bacterium]